MKNKYKIIIAIVVFFLASLIFANWEDFKAGLSGKQPVEEVTK